MNNEKCVKWKINFDVRFVLDEEEKNLFRFFGERERVESVEMKFCWLVSGWAARLSPRFNISAACPTNWNETEREGKGEKDFPLINFVVSSVKHEQQTIFPALWKSERFCFSPTMMRNFNRKCTLKALKAQLVRQKGEPGLSTNIPAHKMLLLNYDCIIYW